MQINYIFSTKLPSKYSSEVDGDEDALKSKSDHDGKKHLNIIVTLVGDGVERESVDVSGNHMHLVIRGQSSSSLSPSFPWICGGNVTSECIVGVDLPLLFRSKLSVLISCFCIFFSSFPPYCFVNVYVSSS